MFLKNIGRFENHLVSIVLIEHAVFIIIIVIGKII